MKLTRDEYDTVQSNLAEGFHTAFRKASGHPNAHKIWMLIKELPQDEWGSVIEFVMWGTFGKRPPKVKALGEKGDPSCEHVWKPAVPHCLKCGIAARPTIEALAEKTLNCPRCGEPSTVGVSELERAYQLGLAKLDATEQELAKVKVMLARHERNLGTSDWLDTAMEAAEAKGADPFDTEAMARVAQLVHEPDAICISCGHPAKNHTLGRCRKKRCGCGGWRGKVVEEGGSS